MENKDKKPLFLKKFAFATIIILLFFILSYIFLYRISYNAMNDLARTISSIINGKGKLSEQIVVTELYDKKKIKIPSNHLLAYYKDLEGLRSGDKVRYEGKIVGDVKLLWFNPKEDERYEIALKFKDKGFKVKKNSRFCIRTLINTNEKYVEIISPENETEYLQVGARIKGENYSETLILDLPFDN